VRKVTARALCFDFDLDTMLAMPTVVTKSDLVQVAAKAGNVSKAAAGEAVNAVFDAIVHNVAKGKRVTVVGFGTFLPRMRKARSGRSPANGKEIKIHAKTIPAFSAGQGFKEAVDKN
jgi:nucleoid DNA-binding protein